MRLISVVAVSKAGLVDDQQELWPYEFQKFVKGQVRRGLDLRQWNTLWREHSVFAKTSALFLSLLVNLDLAAFLPSYIFSPVKDKDFFGNYEGTVADNSLLHAEQEKRCNWSVIS